MIFNINNAMVFSNTLRHTLFPRLSLALETFFVRHRKRLAYVHMLMFVIFSMLLIIPVLLQDPPEHAGMFDHFTIFARALIWSLWFPLVFASVIFTGRSWCGILCPMGAASEWMNRLGPKKPLPRWIEWEGTPILSFVLITIWGQTIGVRDHPEGVATVFGATMLAALALGFLYGKNKRVWCRHFCPIGLMLGVFSRLGMVQFTPKRPLPGPETHTERTVCPTFIGLRSKKESRHCIQCFRCVSPPAPGGLYVSLRKPGEEIARIRAHSPSLSEVWFIFLATGLSLGGFLWLTLPSYEALRQWSGSWLIGHGWYSLLQPGAWWIASNHPARREVFLWLDVSLITGYMLFWMAAGSALMAGVTALVVRLSRRSIAAPDSFSQRFTELGYALAPVAMISLLIGLGGAIFAFAGALAPVMKILLLALSVLWSTRLFGQILHSQGAERPVMALCAAFVGSALIACLWWPALF